jgi:hypothetical protein
VSGHLLLYKPIYQGTAHFRLTSDNDPLKSD